MKTKKCRDCKSEVGKMLMFCPHCGRDFITNTPGIGWIDGFPLASEVIEKIEKKSKKV